MKAEHKTMIDKSHVVDDGDGMADIVARFDTVGSEGPTFEVSIGGEVLDLSSFARLFARNLGAHT